MHKNKKNIFLLVGIVLAIILGIAGVVILLQPPTQQRMHPNTYLHGVPVGGLDFAQAVDVLTVHFEGPLAQLEITYTLDDQPMAVFSFADFGASLDFTGLVASALPARRLDYLTQRLTNKIAPHSPMAGAVALHTMPQKFESVISGLARQVQIPPTNASFMLKNNHIVVLAEVPGRALHQDQLVALTRHGLDSLANVTIPLPVDVIAPAYTTADFDFTTTVLGSFSTKYNTPYSTQAREHNVSLGAQRINNQVVFPGDVFSTGGHIGAHLPNSGYQPATVLVRGEPVKDIGGGVCQVVTTLYNAVLFAELPIVERHNHSAPVSYVEQGFDATVAGDYLDLKFKNVTGHPILISSHMENGQLEISILGFEARPANRHIRFSTNQLELTPATYKEIIDQSLNIGDREVRLPPQDGTKVELIKHVYIEEEEVETHRINTSTYKPLEGIVAIGPR